MEKHQQHIDKILRAKFENFAPTPPDAIWANIEGKLDGASGWFQYVVKSKTYIYFVITVIVIFLFGWLLLGNRLATHKKFQEDKTIEKPIGTASGQQNFVSSDITETNRIATTNTAKKTADKNLVRKNRFKEPETVNKAVENKATPSFGNRNNILNTTVQFQTSAAKRDENGFVAPLDYKETNPIRPLGALLLSFNGFLLEQPRLLVPQKANASSTKQSSVQRKFAGWRTGIFVSPEFTLTNLDSLRVLHSYTVGLDAQYAFDSRFFIRFGLGTSYARDRWFTKIEFNRWDYLGSYNDVYNVTFDTSGEVAVPIYHTHKVDVYDSVRHIDVSETTHTYLYLQFPLLFGYKGKTIGKWSWYLFGGPVLNTMIYDAKTAPLLDDNSSMLRYETHLAERNRQVYQFWLGAGFDYAINSKYSFVVEPNYRYYFNPVYKNYYKNQALAAFSLRFGFFINL